MPNVFDVKEGQGMQLLMDVANTIHQQQSSRREFDLNEKLAKARLDQAKDDNKVATLNSEANLLNALSANGFITKVDQDRITERLPFAKEFTAVSKEARKAQAQQEVIKAKVEGRKEVATVKGDIKKQEIGLKQTGKLEQIGAKSKAGMEKEQLKQKSLSERQEKGLAIESAKFGLSPSDISKGTEAVRETNPIKAERIRTGQEAIVIPGGFLGIGKKTITTDDIINTIGSEEITPRVQEGMKRLNGALEGVKTAEEKAKIVNQFISIFPELAPLFEE